MVIIWRGRATQLGNFVIKRQIMVIGRRRATQLCGLYILEPQTMAISSFRSGATSWFSLTAAGDMQSRVFHPQSTTIRTRSYPVQFRQISI